MRIFDELKRRNVFRAGTAYVITAWLIIQVVETVFPVYGLPTSAVRLVISALAIGFVPALVLAWVFELTPGGLVRDEDAPRTPATSRANAKMLDRIILIVLALAVGFFAFDKFVLSASREAAIAESAREAGRAEAMLGDVGDRSVAVLPFVDMSPEKNQEYMSDGIAEELLNLLSRVRDLRVISRGSSFSFKGRQVDIPTIAERLNATYVLDGSVRLAGTQLRITAQLIDGRTDTQRWSRTWDRELANIFEIQDEIASTVVEELKVTLLGSKPHSRPVDEEAYRLALQARYFWNRRAPGDEEAAFDAYRRAIEIDPDFAAAWAGLSVAYAVRSRAGIVEFEEGQRLAREAANRALALDPNLADAHVRLGQALARADDFEGMRAAYERAYELEPANPLVLGVMARLYGHLGRFEEGIAFLERAEAVDPLGAIWPANKVKLLLPLDRFDEAIRAADKAFAMNGNAEPYYGLLAEIYLASEQWQKALDTLERLPDSSEFLPMRAVAYFRTGRLAESESIMDRIREEAAPLMSAQLAIAHANMGNHDEAFEWLRRITQIAPTTIAYHTAFKPLHDDPRWQAFVATLDLPQ